MNKANMARTKDSRMSRMLALAPGQSIEGIGIRSLRACRSQASDLGIMYGRRYAVNRDGTTVRITRIS